MQPLLKQNKRGGIVTNTILGVVGLVIAVIIGFVIVDTLTGASLLTANSASDNATDRMVGNMTSGVDEVSSKLVTILTIVAVVFILGALALLVRNSRAMGVGGGSSL